MYVWESYPMLCILHASTHAHSRIGARKWLSIDKKKFRDFVMTTPNFFFHLYVCSCCILVRFQISFSILSAPTSNSVTLSLYFSLFHFKHIFNTLIFSNEQKYTTETNKITWEIERWLEIIFLFSWIGLNEIENASKIYDEQQ